MSDTYEQYIVRSIGEQYIALAQSARSRPTAGMTGDKMLRKRLAAHIKEHELSNSEVARRTGVSPARINGILSEEPMRTTTIATVEKLAKGLKVSPAYLLGYEQSSLNVELLAPLLERLLVDFLGPKFAAEFARSVQRAYSLAYNNDVDPKDQKQMNLVAEPEIAALHDVEPRRK